MGRASQLRKRRKTQQQRVFPLSKLAQKYYERFGRGAIVNQQGMPPWYIPLDSLEGVQHQLGEAYDPGQSYILIDATYPIAVTKEFELTSQRQLRFQLPANCEDIEAGLNQLVDLNDRIARTNTRMWN